MRNKPWFGHAGAIALILLVPNAMTHAQTFREDFTGPTLDPGVWLVEPGNGQVVVADGRVTLTCPGGTFPVVTTRVDPFPPGDFRVRVGMQYLAQAWCGDGFGAMDNFWEDYYGVACRPFVLWQDTGGLYVYTGSSGHTLLSPNADLDYHVYEWTYSAGAYQFAMDGVVRAAGACAPRATGIFFGHPHPISCGPWTSFSIDFIEIESMSVTPAVGGTWGGLKVLHR